MNLKLLFLALFAVACHGLDVPTELDAGGGDASESPSNGDNSPTPKKIDPLIWLKGNGEFPSIPGFDAKGINLLKTTDMLGSITELIGALLQSMKGVINNIPGVGGVGGSTGG